jgi:nitrogenase delta subunit
MTTPTANQLFAYVQERCLWQFFSREWDRTENIEGILGKAADLLIGTPLKLETPMDRLFYADAKIMVDDLRGRFPEIAELPAAEVQGLISDLKVKVTEIAVTQSRNRELTQKLY